MHACAAGSCLLVVKPCTRTLHTCTRFAILCTQTIRLAVQAYSVARHMNTMIHVVASGMKNHNVTRKDVRPVLVLPPLKVREEGWRERGCLDRPH